MPGTIWGTGISNRVQGSPPGPSTHHQVLGQGAGSVPEAGTTQGGRQGAGSVPEAGTTQGGRQG